MKNFFVVILFFLNSTYALSSDINVYRGDTRTPEQIKADGGFKPRGYTNFENPGAGNIDLSLYEHAASAHPETGFVSTSINREAALDFAGVEGFLYVIHAQVPNMFNLHTALGPYYTLQNEDEYAALGGIPWTQVVGWYVVRRGVINGNIVRNRDYNASLFRRLDFPNNLDHYRMAGFPQGHAAWRQWPWQQVAPNLCAGNNRNSNNNIEICKEENQKEAWSYLSLIRNTLGINKSVLEKKSTSSTGIYFPSSSYAHKWVDIDGSGRLSYCGMFTDTDRNKLKLTCMKNIGDFKFKEITTTLSDSGWAGSQGWVDINGDNKVDFCRLQYTWTHPVCNLSNGTDFETIKEGPYVDGGYVDTRHWGKIFDKKGGFCRITSSGLVCSSLESDLVSETVLSDSGWKNSRIWLDIDGNGLEDYCRLVYNSTHLRCNLKNTDNTWKTVESGYVDGGYYWQRYSVKMSNKAKSDYCAVTGYNHDTLTCTNISASNSLNTYTVPLPRHINILSQIEFGDIDADGLDDLCFDDGTNQIYCYINKGNKSFNSTHLTIDLSATPLAPINSLETQIINAQESPDNKSAICYNAGFGTSRCDSFLVY